MGVNPSIIQEVVGQAGQIGLINSIVGPELEGLQQRSYMKLPVKIPDVFNLINMVITGWITEEQANEFALKNGYPQYWFKIMLESSRRRLGPGDYVTLLNRGLINEDMFYKKIQEAGFEPRESHLLKAVAEYYPGVNDIVLFSVREVFNPKIAQKYGQFEDFPPEFVTEAAKVGLSEENAKRYWAAHWQLPSPSQGFEMLHRGVIDQAGLNELLRSLDIMPYWREKLTQISYNTLTRVDVRRMYGLGVIDADGVEKAYRDGGYSPENAALLRQFVVKDISDENNGLTKSLIIQSYKKSIVEREQAAILLKRLDYPDDIIELTLTLADYEIMLDTLDQAEKDLTDAFLAGSMSLEQVRDAIRVYQVSENYVAKFTERLKRKAYKSRKKPSVADLKRWLTSGMIDTKDFVSRLVSYGYSEIDAQLYAQETVTDPRVAGG